MVVAVVRIVGAVVDARDGGVLGPERGDLAERDGRATPTNEVDGEAVPAAHFGAILEWAAWEALAERLRAAGVPFLIAPQIRFQGGPGEQATFFVRDPSGNALEFKSFREARMIFARE